jgi:uncharacterized peroxidase-related enzyme
MAFIDTTLPNDAHGEVREMYQRQQDKYGYVPNYAKVFSHRPELMARWAALQSGIRAHVDARRFELATFVASHALESSGCALAHGKLLMQYLSADDVRAIAANELDRTSLSAADVAIVRFARKVAIDAPGVTAGDVATLARHGLSDAEIFDLAAVVAARAFFAKLLDAIGVEADNRFQDLDEQLRAALTVGRPIDYRLPEVMSPANPRSSRFVPETINAT